MALAAASLGEASHPMVRSTCNTTGEEGLQLPGLENGREKQTRYMGSDVCACVCVMKPSAIRLWPPKRFNGDFHEITCREGFN